MSAEKYSMSRIRHPERSEGSRAQRLLTDAERKASVEILRYSSFRSE
jgi:hypothetical protein